MLSNLTWSELRIEDITLPPQEFTAERTELTPPYIITKTEVSKARTLSRDGAHFLAHRLPIIVWGTKNHCICGVRTLHLISPCLKAGELVPVGVLPQATTKERLLELIQLDTLIPSMALAIDKAPSAIYAMSRRIPSSLIKQMTPSLSKGTKVCAELLNVSPPTLYSIKKKA